MFLLIYPIKFAYIRNSIFNYSNNLSIYLIDASRPLDDEDRARLAKLDPERSVVLLNKVDRGQKLEGVDGVYASLITGQGISELKNAMSEALEKGADLQAPPHAVISERHRQLLVNSHREAKQAREYLTANVEENAVLATEHLRSALEFLGQVTGRMYHEELLDNIFSRFCIGK